MTPEDRKLLKLASQAAGYDIRSDARFVGIGGGKETLYMGNGGPKWNPLDDDGDALRLAIMLNLAVEYHPSENGVSAINYSLCASHNLQGAGEDTSADEFAATRRAIVRAAAEIAIAAQSTKEQG